MKVAGWPSPLVLSSAIKVLCEWPFPPRTNSKRSKKRKYIRGLRRHTLYDNCGVCAEWNVLFFPPLKPGMWEIVDVRVILLLSSGIKVYSYPIKVFSVNRMIVETAVFFLITAEQARRLKSLRWKTTDGAIESSVFSLTKCVDFESAEGHVWWLGRPRLIWVERCPQDRGKALTEATLMGRMCWTNGKSAEFSVYLCNSYVFSADWAYQRGNDHGINNQPISRAWFNTHSSKKN